MKNPYPLRVFIDLNEYEIIKTRCQDELNAEPSEVMRTLARLWMAGTITISAEDMVKTRGRDASTA